MGTTSRVQVNSSVRFGWLRWLIIALLVLGVCFRFLCLDRKIYWHDEVYTSLRAAGFMSQALDQDVFQNRWVSIPDLQKFQQIKPGSTINDTIQSLIVEDPQHPPLYFLMARFWMQGFGSSVFASRLLPALIGLLSLPLMYGLAMELFSSRLTALLATALLTLSPFDILFAQTARQYSLLTMIIIGSSWLLLRAMRHPNWQRWGGYGLSIAAGLYTHPFFALTLIAQGVYVVGLSLFKQLSAVTSETSRKQSMTSFVSWIRDRRIWEFALAIVGALILYSPWIWVLLNRSARAMSVTSWAEGPTQPLYFLKLWTLSFTALFIDLDFGFDNPVTYLLRLPFVLLILTALYCLCRRTSTTTWLFMLTSTLVPFLLLALPDLLLGTRRSTVSRYLISCYPGVQLAVAYLFGVGLTTGKQLWRWIFVLSFTCSIVSCSVSAAAKSWWHQVPSYQNAEVIQLVTAAANPTPPVLLSDMGEDFTNTGDLVALSYGLPAETRLFLTKHQAPELMALTNESNIMVFRPSQFLRAAITRQGWQLKPVSLAARLGQIEK